MKKITPDKLIKMKKEGEKITALTSYDYSTAKIVDEAGIDMILIGDSLAMVILGHKTTHAVTMEEMLIFTKAVARGVNHSLIVADMPFGSYQTSLEKATENACRFISAGANAVKIEGGADYTINLVNHLVNQGIPVIAHLGFTPQFLNTIGGYKVQGKEQAQTELILNQAKSLQKAGASALVLEMTNESSAKYIAENLDIPVIGIGAGRYCDGEILVIDDILGKFNDFTPKFVKKYANLHEVITNAVSTYSKEVKEGLFPAKEHVFEL